jgi:hypothetical protein
MNRRLSSPTACAALLLLVSISNPSTAQGPPDAKKQCLSASEEGQNQRDEGHYRAARQSFLACANEACPKVIARSCTQWLREIGDVIPTVVLAAKDDQGNDVTDAKVTLDGQPLATVLDGKPIEADSGEHVFRFEREGSVPAEQKVVLRAGEKARVVTVVLKSVNAAPTPEIEPPTPAAPEAPPPEPTMSAHHVTAGALAVAALASAGVGVFFLLQSNSAKSDAANLRTGLAPDACSQSSATCQSLNDKVNTQFGDLNTSTGLFVAAGGLAAAAVVTWLVWPKSASAPQTTGWITPTFGGTSVGIRGTFE